MTIQRSVLFDPASNITAALRGANSPALTTDSALVVALSPNSSVRGQGNSPSITFIRPTDALPYIAGDVIGINAAGSPGSAICTFSGFPNASLIQLLTSSITINTTSLSTFSTFIMYLFTTSPTAILDNAPFSSPSGDRNSYVGKFTYPQPELIGGGYLFTQTDFIGRAIRLAGTNLFGVLQTVGAGSLASGTEIILRLNSGEVSFT